MFLIMNSLLADRLWNVIKDNNGCSMVPFAQGKQTLLKWHHHRGVLYIIDFARGLDCNCI